MPEITTIELTRDEILNLQKFHAMRRSEDCETAIVGYSVAAKLEDALTELDNRRVGISLGC